MVMPTVLRKKKGIGLGCFAIYLGIENSSFDELFSALIAVKTAFIRGWYNIWLECDSSWVVDIFNGKSQPPSKLSNFWNYCSELWSTKNLKVTHIFKEGNDCPDKLAAFGVQKRAGFLWDETPQFLMEEYNRNKFQLPRFRYV
ncbi:hypothetical protein Lal_00021382 [Lupinus albus]|nr:hypothetical protein Lal_00021382 [Lupinus albus]